MLRSSDLHIADDSQLSANLRTKIRAVNTKFIENLLDDELDILKLSHVVSGIKSDSIYNLLDNYLIKELFAASAEFDLLNNSLKFIDACYDLNTALGEHGNHELTFSLLALHKQYTPLEEAYTKIFKNAMQRVAKNKDVNNLILAMMNDPLLIIAREQIALYPEYKGSGFINTMSQMYALIDASKKEPNCQDELEQERVNLEIYKEYFQSFSLMISKNDIKKPISLEFLTKAIDEIRESEVNAKHIKLWQQEVKDILIAEGSPSLVQKIAKLTQFINKIDDGLSFSKLMRKQLEIVQYRIEMHNNRYFTSSIAASVDARTTNKKLVENLFRALDYNILDIPGMQDALNSDALNNLLSFLPVNKLLKSILEQSIIVDEITSTAFADAANAAFKLGADDEGKRIEKAKAITAKAVEESNQNIATAAREFMSISMDQRVQLNKLLIPVIQDPLIIKVANTEEIKGLKELEEIPEIKIFKDMCIQLNQAMASSNTSEGHTFNSLNFTDNQQTNEEHTTTSSRRKYRL